MGSLFQIAHHFSSNHETLAARGNPHQNISPPPPSRFHTLVAFLLFFLAPLLQCTTLQIRCVPRSWSAGVYYNFFTTQVHTILLYSYRPEGRFGNCSKQCESSRNTRFGIFLQSHVPLGVLLVFFIPTSSYSQATACREHGSFWSIPKSSVS